MTPTQLCDLASRINAAVPGLVGDYKLHGFLAPGSDYEYNNSPATKKIVADEAAMMLGRCAAWMEENMHDLMGPTRQTIVGAYRTLRDYVAITLPGAKP